jgi:hypothetical protein
MPNAEGKTTSASIRLAWETKTPLNVDPQMPHRLHIRPARNYTQSSPGRNRVLHGVLVLAVIVAGLLWRASFMPLPPSVAKYGGYTLWSLMVFLGLGFLLARASTLVVALLALTFSWGVEFSQLYQAPWIDAIRATLPGRLVLGSTFNLPDLPAYALGVGLGAWAEWRLRR